MPFIEYQGEVRELTPGETYVGSGTQAAWRIQNADLAARHFALVTDAGATRVRCHSGQHIVAVNGRPVGSEAVALRAGDVVSAGSARFLYLDRAEAARPAGWEEAPAAATAYLANEAAREVYPLERRAVTIGRDAASNVHLSDPSVSRFHADVRREAGLFVLYSAGSSGTRVNGHRVAGPTVLEEGDRVEVGDTTLVFTRKLPAELTLVRLTEAQEGRISHRDSVTRVRALGTGEFERFDDGRRRMVPLAVGVAVVVIAVLAYLLTR